VHTEEKLTLALHRSCLILLGKPSLREIVIKLLKWLLTERFRLQADAIGVRIELNLRFPSAAVFGHVTKRFLSHSVPQ